MVSSASARILDASTAHRTAAGWEYGFPEMTPEQSGRIAASRRVANPGCYPQGYIACVRPLVEAGLLPRGFAASYNATSGYSGGGKSMIAAFEAGPEAETGGRAYGLMLKHKHAPEMHAFSGLDHPPVFAPLVGRYRQGMIGQVPLALWALPGVTAERIADVLAARYAGMPRIRVRGLNAEPAGSLDAEALNGTDDMELFVFANAASGQAILVSRYDNLGKGASGAAVQNMEVMLGLHSPALARAA
jgi:N-acetyl-gamma-glutamyl-phosphate reductase